MCMYDKKEQQASDCNGILHDHHGHEHHDHSLVDELVVHMPTAVFSVAVSFMILTIVDAMTASLDSATYAAVYHKLFHSFHYLHIVFAGIGTLLTFFNFSKRMVPALIVGVLSPAIFCVLSDVVLPYVAGSMLGLHMDLHVCFFTERFNIIAFLLIGLLTGLFIQAQQESGSQSRSFLRIIHFSHILLSSLASLFYMVSYGFGDWVGQMGLIFLVMIVCVVVPCTLSDVVVPISIAHLGRRE